MLAKELTSVDVVSNGRLIFGLGIGYLKPEFEALGIPFDKKGARSMDYLQAMKAVWTQEKPVHHGEFVAFSAVFFIAFVYVIARGVLDWGPAAKPTRLITVDGDILSASRTVSTTIRRVGLEGRQQQADEKVLV